jgi:hypothetical protein
VAADAAFYSARNEAAAKAKGVKPDRGRTKLWCQEAIFEEEPGRRAAAKLLTRDEGGASPPMSPSCRSCCSGLVIDCVRAANGGWVNQRR